MIVEGPRDDWELGDWEWWLHQDVFTPDRMDMHADVRETPSSSWISTGRLFKIITATVNLHGAYLAALGPLK